MSEKTIKTKRRSLLGVGNTIFQWLLILTVVCAESVSVVLAANEADIDSAKPLDNTVNLQRRGQFAEASAAADSAVKFYAKIGDRKRQFSALIRLAETQQTLGEFQDAENSLTQALALARELDDITSTAIALGALGNVYIALGPADRAEDHLTRGLALAKKADTAPLKATILNNLGNYYSFQENHSEAMSAFKKSAALARESGEILTAARALANAARAAIRSEDSETLRKLVEQALNETKKLPNSHDKSYLLANIARTLMRANAPSKDTNAEITSQSYRLLAEADKIATQLGDMRASSYAQGYLGALYEKQRRYAEALQLTRKAKFLAQQLSDSQLLYLWYWQSARLFHATGKSQAAIDEYRKAVALLKELRFQMAVTYGAAGSSFEELVDPVYTGFVDLLLRSADHENESGRQAEILNEARNTVELLKAAELRDYFRDDCVDALQAKRKPVQEASQSALVIYPVILADRTELLVDYPGGSIKRYSSPVTSDTLIAEIRSFRRLLEKRTTNEFRAHGRKLYDWLIKPLESDLAGSDIDTLVFVPDGALGTIPMSALYDGNDYLIAKYAVVITPGMELTDPRHLPAQDVKLVLGGLSKSVAGYPALPYVPEELTSIRELHGGKLLLDENFQRDSLKASLEDNSLNIVHISTHGEFKGNVDDSFLLTYDGRLTIDQLAEYVGVFKFRETPLELLVLSACETAQGDDRAALGLSGIAIKAGARSALGTLWQVNDLAASRLMTEFYGQLKRPKTSRAAALQKAQLSLLKDLDYRHPSYWAAFLLINNWL